MIIRTTLPSPVGTIVVDCDDRHVIGITIARTDISLRDPSPPTRVAAMAVEQLRAYFDGSLAAFDLPLRPLASARGEALRQAICAIPFGQTMSYGAVARTIDSGPRAIGQACRRNPMPIIVPCHRVLGTGGIGYYSGGAGVETKLWLLRHEGAAPASLV